MLVGWFAVGFVDKRRGGRGLYMFLCSCSFSASSPELVDLLLFSHDLRI